VKGLRQKSGKGFFVSKKNRPRSRNAFRKIKSGLRKSRNAFAN